MSETVAVRARVRISLDGRVYEPGQWIRLPDTQRRRARGLVAYGLAEEAPDRPVTPPLRRS